MYDGQPDLFDIFNEEYVDTRSELEKENESLKDLLMGYAMSNDVDNATDKLLKLIVKRMGRYFGENTRKRIILSSYYTVHKDIDDEMIFANFLNSTIHDFDLMCHDWDDYYAQRKSSRKKR